MRTRCSGLLASVKQFFRCCGIWREIVQSHGWSEARKLFMGVRPRMISCGFSNYGTALLLQESLRA